MKKLRVSLLAFVICLSCAVFTGCFDDDSSSSSKAESSLRTEETEAEKTVTLSDKLTEVGHETGIGIKLPSNYIYNNGYSCWSDIDFINAVWVRDTQVYKTADEIKSALGNLSGDIKEMTVGSFMAYVSEDPNGFYGASSNYFIDFGKKIGNYEGMRILVSNIDEDITQTQSDIVKEMLSSAAPMS